MNDRNYRNEANRQRERAAGHRLLYADKRFWLLIAAVVCVCALLSWMVYMLMMPGDAAAAGANAPEHLTVQSPDGAGNNGSAVENPGAGGNGSIAGNADNGSTSGSNIVNGVSGGSPGSAQMGPREHLDSSMCPKDWNLRLVNPWNGMSENPDVKLTQLANGHSVDERCYPDLQEMMDDCRADGLSPVICSSYRTWETQQSLFDANVNKLVAQGYSRAAAETETAKAIAVPGTSEHQLGLALDIVDVNNQNLDETQEDTPVQKWLMKNSWKYGFILRYPNDKSDITGIIYEPWHYRYVGKDIAKEIYDADICLEEYLEQLCAKG